jgi:GT2 family glycosyltransferase
MKTLTCLKHLKECELPNNTCLKVFIADSNSPDNTLKLVKESYPDVEIFNVGDEVYWNQGTIMAWKKAALSNSNFFLWLNDDTYLYKNGLKILIDNYYSLKKQSILIGVTQYNGVLTYGGRKIKYNNDLVIPNGSLQKVNYMNGNCVLISHEIFVKLGFLSKKYNHSLGDIDYGFRALKNKIELHVCSEVIADCPSNNFRWYDPKNSLLKRFKLLLSPKGLPLKEYIYFNYTFFGIFKVVKFTFSVITALFLPNLFIKIQKK